MVISINHLYKFGDLDSFFANQNLSVRQFEIKYSQVTNDYKFSDQSHFIKEFKSFSNDTPNKFLKNINNYPQINGLQNIK